MSTKFSSFISKESIKYLISLSLVLLIFDLSFVIIIVDVNSLNALEKALLITFSLSKLILNGSEISISSILKILLSTFDVNIELKNKVDKQKIIKETILINFFLVYILNIRKIQIYNEKSGVNINEADKFVKYIANLKKKI